MKILPPLILLSIPFCLFLLCSQGCSNDRAHTKRLANIVAIGSQWYGHMPLWIGIEKGIFREQGFAVKWQSAEKDMDSLSAVSSNLATVASPAETDMLVAMAFDNNGFYWVASPAMATGLEGLVAAPGISGMEELKGRRIGYPFASSAHITCRELLKNHGLDPGRDVLPVNLEPRDIAAFFVAGRLDAAVIWEPVFSQLAKIQGATVLGLDKDTESYKQFKTVGRSEVLVLNRAWVDEDRQRAEKFMAAYFEAVDWVQDHPEQAAQIAAGKYIQQDSEQILRAMKTFTWYPLAQQQRIMSENGMFAQADTLVQMLHEEMHAIPVRPDFRKWVNTGMLPGTSL